MDFVGEEQGDMGFLQEGGGFVGKVKEANGCEVFVTGDTGPIEVGMGMTTYSWSVSKPGRNDTLTSKKDFDRIEEARDAALKASERWSKM